MNSFAVPSALGFPGGARIKEPTCQCRRHEMMVRSLGGEDPLGVGTATHCSILTRRIPWTEEPGRLQPIRSHRVGHNSNDFACTRCTDLGSLLRSRLLWTHWVQGFPGGSGVKNLPVKQETLVPSLGWEDPLEKGMATYSSTLAWKIPGTEGAWRVTVHGVTRVRHD